MEVLRDIVERMLQKGCNMLEICDLTGVTEETVNEIFLALQN